VLANRYLRLVLASLPWLIAPTILGYVVLHGLGAALGFAFGVIYVFSAIVGADRLVLDIYEGRLMTPAEEAEIPDMVEKYAAMAGIPEPSLYYIALDEPNIIAWASGDGTKGIARIGIPPRLGNVLTIHEQEALIALAIARIASGEAAVLAKGATLAGLGLQFVFWKLVNVRLGIFRWDPDTRLTPLGTILLALTAPLAWLSAKATLGEEAIEHIDADAARMFGDQRVMASAIYKLAAAGPEPGTGALRAYNPGLAPMFMVSPFDKLSAVAGISPLPAKIAAWIADVNPSCATRGHKVENLRPLAPEIAEAPEEPAEPEAGEEQAEEGPKPTA
jgi:Zn-dependent protease with chaperone function